MWVAIQKWYPSMVKLSLFLEIIMGFYEINRNFQLKSALEFRIQLSISERIKPLDGDFTPFL